MRKPEIWSRLNGQTSFSQPRARETAQIPIVLHVSIVDLFREHCGKVWLLVATQSLTHLAAALTALVTLNPKTLKQAILMQITPLIMMTVL